MTQAGFKLTFFLATVLLLAVVCFQGFSVTSPADRDETVLKVGILEESPPYDFFDEKNELTGMNIELIREMGRRLGRKTELVPVSYNRIIVGLLFRQYDVIAAPQSISDYRAKTVRFLAPYLQSSDVLVYHARQKQVQTLADIQRQHLKLGVFNGTSYPAFLKKQGLEKSMSIYPTQREMFLAFEAGKIDAMLMDEQIAKHYRQVEKYPLEFSRIPVRADKIMAFSVRKEDLKLANQLNIIFKSMQADGTADAIKTKWLNPGNPSEIALRRAL